MKIFLDLDGVIRDWCDGIFKLFKVDPFEVTSWDMIDKKICKEYGISKTYFWERQGEYFWTNLKMFDWAKELLNFLPYDKTCILTSPTLTSAGYSQAWISRFIPNFFYDKKYLIGPAKHFCANEDSLLIDDADHNVEAFRKAGGNAILFPQPWNKLREIANDDQRIPYVRASLDLFI